MKTKIWKDEFEFKYITEIVSSKLTISFYKPTLLAQPDSDISIQNQLSTIKSTTERN